MLAELSAFLGAEAPQISIVDVDGSEELRRRFGHRVPVLLLDGDVVCHGHFDRAELERLTRRFPGDS